MYGRFNVPKAPRRAEKKFVDITTDLLLNNNVESTVAIPSLFYITRGDGPSQRIGSKVFAEKITFRYVIKPGALNTNSVNVGPTPVLRLMVIQDMQCNGTVPVPAEVITAQALVSGYANPPVAAVLNPGAQDQSLSFMNISNSKRFRIIHDKIHVFNEAIAAYTTEPETISYRYSPKIVDKTKNLKYDIEFDTVGTAGSFDVLKSNNLFVLISAGNSFNNQSYQLTFTSRLRYTDS